MPTETYVKNGRATGSSTAPINVTVRQIFASEIHFTDYDFLVISLKKLETIKI